MENEQLVARIQAGEDVAENMLKLYGQNKGFIAKVAKSTADSSGNGLLIAPCAAFWTSAGKNYKRSRKASRSGRYAVSARRWAGKRQTLRLGTP